MKLYEKKITQAEQILSLELEQLASILESKKRARALQNALAKAFKDRLSTKEALHISQTVSLNQDRDFIKRLYKSTGQDYDLMVTELFNVVGLKAFRRDQLGMSKGDPDIEITHNGERVFVECKTTKDTGSIDLSEASAIFGKAANLGSGFICTVGKPDFSEVAINKMVDSTKITLIPHAVLVEMLIRFWDGKMTTQDCFQALIRRGYLTINSLDDLTK